MASFTVDRLARLLDAAGGQTATMSDFDWQIKARRLAGELRTQGDRKMAEALKHVKKAPQNLKHYFQ